MFADHAHARTSTSSEAKQDGLSIDLLGQFGVRVGSTPVPDEAFPRRKAMALLKLLALQPGNGLHRDQVLEQLWPDLKPESASAQLHKAVHHVRQAIGSIEPNFPPEEAVQIGGEMIRLSAPGGVHTDVAAFEQAAGQALLTRDLAQLREAARMYSGDLLPADIYEPWVIRRHESLAERYVEVLVELGNAALGLGRLTEAAEALRLALSRDSQRENAHRALMLVFVRQGSRARAIRQYQICVDILAGELVVGVSRETEMLYEEILAEKVAGYEPDHRPPLLEISELDPLIGRRTEIEALSTALDRLAGGRGAVLGIEGPAGSGKTRLAQELVQLGRARRYHTLFGSAHEQEGQMAYLPFVEALRGALWDNPTGADLIPADLAAAIPEIPASAPPVTVADRVAAQHALFAGVLRFLAARAGSGPLILILDDLHSADEGSLKLFHYLARQTPQIPLLLVGVWRSHDPDASPVLADTVGNLERRLDLKRIKLARLDQNEHTALLEQALDGGAVSPDLAGELYRLSDGNALFAREIARQIHADGDIVKIDGEWTLAGAPDFEEQFLIHVIPASLQELTRRRVQSLSPEANKLIQIAAVAGRETPFPVVETCWGTTEPLDGLLQAATETSASGLLDETGFGYRFPHPLLREAVYAEISASRRRALHRDVAEALEELYARDQDTLPVDDLARHYRQTGDRGRAIDYLLVAGDRAARVYDQEGALERYRRALDLTGEGPVPERVRLRAEIQERIGDSFRSIGDVTRSLAAYVDAIELSASLDAPESRQRRFSLHRKAVLAAVLAADLETAGQHLASATSLLGPEPIDEARLLIATALFDWHILQFEAAVEHAERALDIAERSGAVVETSQACEMLALAHLPLGNWQEGLEYELRRQRTDSSTDIVVAVDAHLCMFQFRLHSADSYHEGRTFLEATAREAEAFGNLRCLAICRFVLGYLAMLQGHPEEAADYLAGALELHQRIGAPAAAAYTLACQIELSTITGHHDAGWPLVSQGLELSNQAAIRDHCLTQIYTAAIHNRLGAEDATQLADVVQAAIEHDASCGPCAVCQADLYEALAAYYLVSDDAGRAVAHIEQALPLVDFVQNLPGRARLLRMHAQIHAARGDTGEAGRCLLEAAALFREAGDLYDHARTMQVWSNLGTGADGDRTKILREADAIVSRYRTAVIPEPS
ncbi:BTAD domain-containing putative transcriptional regulator [soil metagenome]